MIAKFRFELRPTVSTDITGLMGIDHSCDSEYVWQLDLQKSSGQIAAVLREVRLPRAIHVKYPREVFSLADEWNHNTRMLTALGSNRHPVGYIRYFENVTAGSVWISDLAVSLESRRRGIGTALALSVQDWASEQGFRQIFLEMPSKNHPAIRMAHKLGFEFSGYNDHYYATQDVALFFGRYLR
jgi:ribosomal protein S18 acetylase RimI-like enzyme